MPRGTVKGTVMPRWTQDPETGKDVANVRMIVPIDRAQFATLRNYQRDNEGTDLRTAILTALYIGLQELGETYDPTRAKKR